MRFYYKNCSFLRILLDFLKINFIKTNYTIKIFGFILKKIFSYLLEKIMLPST